MKFEKYQHVERFGTAEVQDIEIGKTFVFPKLDGTNSSVWLEDGEVKAGSRNRELSLDKDNAGFYNDIINDEDIKGFLTANPSLRLFGEWLVPHTLKTYQDDAWRKFYVFDVMDSEGNYIPYTYYSDWLSYYNVLYLAPIRIFINASLDDYVKCLEQNNYLVKEGLGEGIVIKNYDFKNKYGRTTWAKIVRTEFKQDHSKKWGAPLTENHLVEELIADKFVTKALCEKEYNKIVTEEDGWSSKYIPRLLNVIFYCLVKEDMWEIVKEFKNPTINFKTLCSFTTKKIKELLPDVFGG